MAQEKPIPCYNADGISRGFRSPECARRLIEAGLVTPVYGRKGHLRAIFARRDDGAAAVGDQLPLCTRYSFREHLDNGYLCWRLRRLDLWDRDGAPLNSRAVFVQVIRECLVGA